jgi:hypothetical protein
MRRKRRESVKGLAWSTGFSHVSEGYFRRHRAMVTMLQGFAKETRCRDRLRDYYTRYEQETKTVRSEIPLLLNSNTTLQGSYWYDGHSGQLYRKHGVKF